MPRIAKPQFEVKENAAPASMSVEMYAKLVERVRTSKKESEVNACFSQIVEALKPRIRSICANYRIAGCSYEDIYQEALFALRYKAIEGYDKDKGTEEGIAPFDRFATVLIRRHLATAWKTSKQVRKIALNQAISLTQERGESDEELSLINIIPGFGKDVLNTVERREYISKLMGKLLAKLAPFEREVLMLMIEKRSYAEIASILNHRNKSDKKKKTNVKGVDNALSRIKTKARQVFDKYGDKELRIRDVTKEKLEKKAARRSGKKETASV